MAFTKMTRFLLQAIAVGIAAAVIITVFLPEDGERPVVQVQQVVPAPQPSAAMAMGPVSYADAVKRAAPAVVNIYTRKVITERANPFFDDPLFQRFFGERFGAPRQRTQTSLGSGVIVSDKGYVLTNFHVIADADQIEVLIADGRAITATVVGRDPETDLAVLKIGARDLPSITFGDAQNLQVGDVVLAIGNPYGVGQTVTQGIISATGRNRLGINTYENFIQTDAAINPGNSGGALINAYGELIGINTAIFSRSGGSQGIGFAIPLDLAKDVMTQIIEKGHVVRGWLGVEAQDLSPQLVETFGLKNHYGVLIAGVMRGGPAHRAGIRPGDVLTALDGHPIFDARAALNSIARYRPGSTLKIQGIREGKPFEVEVKVVERPVQG